MFECYSYESVDHEFEIRWDYNNLYLLQNILTHILRSIIVKFEILD